MMSGENVTLNFCHFRVPGASSNERKHFGAATENKLHESFVFGVVIVVAFVRAAFPALEIVGLLIRAAEDDSSGAATATDESIGVGVAFALALGAVTAKDESLGVVAAKELAKDTVLTVATDESIGTVEEISAATDESIGADKTGFVAAEQLEQFCVFQA